MSTAFVIAVILAVFMPWQHGLETRQPRLCLIGALPLVALSVYCFVAARQFEPFSQNPAPLRMACVLAMPAWALFGFGPGLCWKLQEQLRHRRAQAQATPAKSGKQKSYAAVEQTPA